MKDLSGKFAVVTGAQKGIGYAIAKRFLEENVAGVAIIDLNAFDTTEMDPTGRAVSYACNIADGEMVADVFAQIYERFGRIDILVNNAGIIKDAMFHKMNDAQWNAVMNVNIGGMYNCCKQVIGKMRDQEYGRIINISSTSASGAAGQCNYSLTKSGVIGFTKSLAKEGARKNITVNAVAPDFIKTDMMLSVPKEVMEESLRQAPMHRMGEPEEVAALVTYLASDDATYVSGECIRCGGAFHT